MPVVELEGDCNITFQSIGFLAALEVEGIANVTFHSLGLMTPIVPTVAPPSDLAFVKRVSVVYPEPDLNDFGRPVDWEPEDATRENWGRLRVLINNVDVTFYRGIPVQIGSWVDNEPFGYARAAIRFPQISPMEALPDWLADWVNVDIYLVRPNGTQKLLWCGLFADEEDGANETDSGLEIQVIGALYQADLYQMPPALYPQDDDIGSLIIRELDPANRPNLRTLPVIGSWITGIFVRAGGSWDALLTGYIQGLLDKSTYIDVIGPRQWTVKMEGRRPTFTIKDVTTVSWTMRAGQPGITHQLSRDLSMLPNVIYGEGVDNEQCHWRNTKYPNLRIDDAPVFPGTVMEPGDTLDPDVGLWQQEMYNNGWTDMVVDSFYDPDEEWMVRQFQEQAGILVDGIVGPQTWAAIFETGSNAGDLTGAFFMPVYADTRVQPRLYNPSGGDIGANPAFESGRVRVERYENFGNYISKAEGISSAAAEIERDGGGTMEAGFMGTLTLGADPNEGSRFEIRAGENFLLQGHRGEDRLLHISQVEVDWDGQAVSLTVDERCRDQATMAAILQRDRENHDPARRKKVQYRNSKQVEDRRAEWDCENGSGIIPRHGTFAGLWNVLRIPAGEVGTVVRSEFTVDTPARFSVAVFDRPTTHTVLSSHGASPLDAGYWDTFPEETGLIIAWGGEGQAGGFYPLQESDEDAPLTGRMLDDASWYYRSTAPPWLWVALWVESPSVNYIQGRLYAGVSD